DTTYARLSFDVTPTSEVFATFNYGATTTITLPSGSEGFNVTLPCNYAFLPGSITAVGGLGSAAALAAGNLQQACFDNYGGAPSAGYPVGSMPVGVAINT